MRPWLLIQVLCLIFWFYPVEVFEMIVSDDASGFWLLRFLGTKNCDLDLISERSSWFDAFYVYSWLRRIFHYFPDLSIIAMLCSVLQYIKFELSICIPSWAELHHVLFTDPSGTVDHLHLLRVQGHAILGSWSLDVFHLGTHEFDKLESVLKNRLKVEMGNPVQKST